MVRKIRQECRESGVTEREQKRAAGDVAGPGEALPLAFSGCFGWLYRANGRQAVVLCAPQGYEAQSTHRNWGAFATQLAAAGIPTLRFDYPYSGDSAGNDTDPAILRRALDAIQAAVALLRRQPGIERVVLVGLRFGAVLAATAAQELARAGQATDALVLLAPCASGAAYAKELRVTSMLAKERRPNEGSGLPGLEAVGFYYSPATLAEMKALDPAAASERPASRVLLMDRAENPGGTALGEAFGRLGAAVENMVFEEYSVFMRDAAEAEYPAADFARVVAWIGADPSAERDAPSAITAEPEIAVADGVERPVWIDGPTPLFGFLSEPAQPAADRPVMLILNTEANPHVGVNRLSVLLARRLLHCGIASLRVDLGGIGDSPAVPGRPDKSCDRPAFVADVRQAVDWLARRGYRRIVATGHCAGGWVSYKTSLVEPRITGQILINVQGLWPQPPSSSGKFESNRTYLRLLFAASTWRRMLKGEIRVREIARVLRSRLGQAILVRLKRLAGTKSTTGTLTERTLGEVADLTSRNVTTELIYVESNPGIDELELHFGHRGKMLASAGIRLTFIEGDHLFAYKNSRERLLELMASRFEPSGTALAGAEAMRATAPGDARPVLKGNAA